MIGFDADVVVWHDLWSGHWPGGKSTFAEYDERVADRMAVATAAAERAPALAQPSRITECRHCPWWPTCEAVLTSRQDVSLVVRGEVAAGLREARIFTVDDLARQDPAGELPVPGVPVADTIALARAWQRHLPVVRRVPRVPVLRADVEVDVDMESFGESGAYLWGALLDYPGGRRPEDPAPGYHAFATWDPLPSSTRPARSRSSGAGCPGCGAGRGVRSQLRGLLLQRARREPLAPRVGAALRRTAGGAHGRGGRGVHRHPAWVDIYAVVDEWFLCAHGKGLKRIAPAAGFGGAIPRQAGRTPCGGTAMPSASTARRPIPPSGSGCWSTTPMTSPPPTPSGCG